jgi:hypothetical protein
MKYPIENKFGETVEPTGHIRERIAASVMSAKPSGYEIARHYEIRLTDPIGFFLYTFNERHREFAGEWADNFLVALDNAGLRVVEVDEAE